MEQEIAPLFSVKLLLCSGFNFFVMGDFSFRKFINLDDLDGFQLYMTSFLKGFTTGFSLLLFGYVIICNLIATCKLSIVFWLVYATLSALIFLVIDFTGYYMDLGSFERMKEYYSSWQSISYRTGVIIGMFSFAGLGMYWYKQVAAKCIRKYYRV